MNISVHLVNLYCISEAYETLHIYSFMNAAFYLLRCLLKENQ